MTIEIEAMVVAAEVTVVAVEAAADRPLLSIVLDGSTAHVHVLTHHVAIDSFLQSGPMNFCKKSERTVESASVSISVYQNFGSCSERIRGLPWWRWRPPPIALSSVSSSTGVPLTFTFLLTTSLLIRFSNRVQ